jgi:SynChlorMet cassette protein ScmD
MVECMEMVSKDIIPIANPMIVLREEFDDWAILFDPDTGKAFGINPVAASIWKLLDGKHTKNDIESAIRESYREVPSEMDSQIKEFLVELVEHGFAGYEV